MRARTDILPFLRLLNPLDDQAVYSQIVWGIMRLVAGGTLKDGDVVPTVREFSKHYGINQNTMVKALRELEVRGVLKPQRGLGTCVPSGGQRAAFEGCKAEAGKMLLFALDFMRDIKIPEKEILEYVSSSAKAKPPVQGSAALTLAPATMKKSIRPKKPSTPIKAKKQTT